MTLKQCYATCSKQVIIDTQKERDWPESPVCPLWLRQSVVELKRKGIQSRSATASLLIKNYQCMKEEIKLSFVLAQKSRRIVEAVESVECPTFQPSQLVWSFLQCRYCFELMHCIAALPPRTS